MPPSTRSVSIGVDGDLVLDGSPAASAAGWRIASPRAHAEPARRPAARLVPARDRGLVGRRRAGLGRPGAAGQQGDVRGRPGAAGGAGGRGLGRGPARRAPPAVSQGCAQRRADDAEGPHPRSAPGRRLRAPDRAHERRPGGGRGVGGAGDGPRAHRPGPDHSRRHRTAGQADHLRPRGGRRPRAPGAGRGGGGGDRRLRQRVVLDPGRGPVPTAPGRQPHHRRGRGTRGRRRGADRVRAGPRGPAQGRRGDAGGAPLRGAGVRRRRARRPRYDADRQRPDRHDRGDHARRLRAAGGQRAARDGARRPDGRRSHQGGPPGGRLRGSGRLLARRGAAYRRRRLRDQRPAPPSGERVPRALCRLGGTRARGRRALGRRVDLASGGGREGDRGRPSGDTVETRVSTLCTDPWTSHTGEDR